MAVGFLDKGGYYILNRLIAGGKVGKGHALETADGGSIKLSADEGAWHFFLAVKVKQSSGKER